MVFSTSWRVAVETPGWKVPFKNHRRRAWISIAQVARDLQAKGFGNKTDHKSTRLMQFIEATVGLLARHALGNSHLLSCVLSGWHRLLANNLQPNQPVYICEYIAKRDQIYNENHLPKECLTEMSSRSGSNSLGQTHDCIARFPSSAML